MAKKTFIGTVVSDKLQKTAVVEVTRKIQHPLYKKIIKKTRKFLVDTNGVNVKAGNIVKIEETRPLSRHKNFKIIEIK